MTTDTPEPGDGSSEGRDVNVEQIAVDAYQRLNDENRALRAQVDALALAKGNAEREAAFWRAKAREAGFGA